MTENKLPSGVGKKIVQALKKQAEVEINTIPEEVVTTEEAMSAISQDNLEDNESEEMNLEENFSDFAEGASFFPEPEPLNLNTFKSSVDNSQDILNPDDYNFDTNDSISYEEEPVYTQPKSNHQPQKQSQVMPSNVAVLKRLITQLPGGVTKQTGAQIIRQTMEALGISMNSVLKEAQQVQDSLNDSARTCMSTMQEYKNKIKSLEKQVGDYKKQAIALNDLISLFVLTDKR